MQGVRWAGVQFHPIGGVAATVELLAALLVALLSTGTRAAAIAVAATSCISRSVSSCSSIASAGVSLISLH